MSDNELQVYTYRGEEGEAVPVNVAKLIVDNAVRILTRNLCYDRAELQEVTLPDGLLRIEVSVFGACRGLLEISLGSNMQIIGREAFGYCEFLKKVEFAASGAANQQLHTIDAFAFFKCTSLPKIKVPASVNSIGESAFGACSALIEADLSKTRLIEVSDGAFYNCWALQTVSLPNTLVWICYGAFMHCFGLVAVVVPLDSQPIKIGRGSFKDCRQLAIFSLPKDSTAKEDSFRGCGLLHKRYGENSSSIVGGLVGRFENYPVHRMCYNHSGISPEEMRKCIDDQGERCFRVDEFRMTPFHVLFLTAEPSLELLKVLLVKYSYKMVNRKDANGKRPLDYLIKNWTDATATLVETTLQKWVVDPLVDWGAMYWAEAMRTKLQALLSEHPEDQRLTILNEIYSAFGKFEKIECTSVCELALWKCRLKSERSKDGLKRQALLDRVESRCVCGSDIVIPNVTVFLFA